MKWYEKYKVGERVRVTKITLSWNYGIPAGWNSEGEMDGTVGKIYKIISINKAIGYYLDTSGDVGQSYWYPIESLETLVGKQLEFAFME